MLATLPAIAVAPAQPPLTPLVLLDGVPEPNLTATAVEIAGALDQLSATIEVSPSADGASGEGREWAGRAAEVALPLRLADGRVRWLVLARGRLALEQERTAARRAGRTLRLEDHWAELLSRPLAGTWEASSAAASGLVFSSPARGVLGLGGSANRSATRFEIAGRQVYVPQRRLAAAGAAGAWTVGEALATLLAFAGIEASLAPLPAAVRAAPLLEPIELSRPLGEALASVAGPYGLGVRRELWREGGRGEQRLALHPAAAGATVRLAWADAAGGRPLGAVLRVERDRPIERAEPWIARAAGCRVESTFALVGGWDPALEGQPEAAYQRDGHADFARDANVYRLWALNEDGRFTPPPFGRGPAFDLAAFFGESRPIAPRPLPFGPCLTLDDTGRPRAPIVEVSLDGGASWSGYGGAALPRPDHAAVYLDDAALPAPFLAAALAGQARVRITASLRCPLPVEAVRWRGNPFAGAAPARVFDLGEAIAFRRIEAGSIHHDAVRAGLLAADEADGTAALRDWLVERLARAAAAGEAAGEAEPGRATLALSGAWPLLRPGDRLIDESPQGSAADGQRRGRVTRVRLRWPGAEQGTEHRRTAGAPATLVDLSL